MDEFLEMFKSVSGFAELLGTLHKQLVAEGFTREEALELTKVVMMTILAKNQMEEEL